MTGYGALACLHACILAYRSIDRTTTWFSLVRVPDRLVSSTVAYPVYRSIGDSTDQRDSDVLPSLSPFHRTFHVIALRVALAPVHFPLFSSLDSCIRREHRRPFNCAQPKQQPTAAKFVSGLIFYRPFSWNSSRSTVGTATRLNDADDLRKKVFWRYLFRRSTCPTCVYLTLSYNSTFACRPAAIHNVDAGASAIRRYLQVVQSLKLRCDDVSCTLNGLPSRLSNVNAYRR